MREQYRIVEARLIALGLPYRLISGGKHRRYEVLIPGQVIRIPIASSPRDRHTAGINTAKQIVRAVSVAQARGN